MHERMQFDLVFSANSDFLACKQGVRDTIFVCHRLPPSHVVEMPNQGVAKWPVDTIMRGGGGV